MQFSITISAGGDPAFVREQVSQQVAAQLGTASGLAQAKLATALEEYVTAVIGEAQGTVSVSGYVSVSITLPDPITAASDEPAEEVGPVGG